VAAEERWSWSDGAEKEAKVIYPRQWDQMLR